MKDLVEFDLDEGGSILVEVDDADLAADYVRASTPGEVAAKAETTFESSLSVIRTSASKVLEQVASLETEKTRLSEVEVEFGIKLSGKVGAIIASTEAEGHFQVTLKWTRG